MAALAVSYSRQSRCYEAEELETQVMIGSSKTWGLDHAMTIGAMIRLAVTRKVLGRLDDAVVLLEQAREIRKKTFAPTEPESTDLSLALEALRAEQQFSSTVESAKTIPANV